MSIPFPQTRHLRTAFLAAALGLALTPQFSSSFFQNTQLSGSLGSDIGGVWLVVEHQMPEFRVRLENPQDGNSPIPFEVGPLPQEAAPLMGPSLAGVVVTKITDEARAARFSIFVGDVLIKFNTHTIGNIADYRQALANAPKLLLLTIRRQHLKFSSARVLKIKYDAAEATEDGDVSVVGTETVRIETLDLKLPMADAVQERRKARELWMPSPDDAATVGASWWKLPAADPISYIRGEHKMYGENAYNSTLSNDPHLDGSKFALVMDLEGNPMTGGGKIIDIFGFESVTPDKLEGSYIHGIVTTAPFPINLQFVGRFTMTRLEDYSTKDVDYLAEIRAAQEPEESYDDIELAPDVPAELKE